MFVCMSSCVCVGGCGHTHLRACVSITVEASFIVEASHTSIHIQWRTWDNFVDDE